MATLPEPKGGRPRITRYNARILELMKRGWGLDRIYHQLVVVEGASIGRSSLHKRMREIRDNDKAGLPLVEEDPGLVRQLVAA